MRLVLLQLVLSMSMVSCGGNSGKDPGDSDETFDPLPIPNDNPILPPSNLTCPSGTNLTYDNFGESFFRRYCTVCHHSSLAEDNRGSAPIHINLETELDVQVWRANIALVATGDDPMMPPSSNVPPEERDLLSEWLSCGAPQ